MPWPTTRSSCCWRRTRRRGSAGPRPRERLQRYGPNLLPQASTGGPIRRLLRQLQQPADLRAARRRRGHGRPGRDGRRRRDLRRRGDQRDRRVHPGVQGRGRAGRPALDGAHVRRGWSATGRTRAGAVRDAGARRPRGPVEAGDKVPADIRLLERRRAAGGRVGADRGVGPGGQGRGGAADRHPGRGPPQHALLRHPDHDRLGGGDRGGHRVAHRAGRDPPPGRGPSTRSPPR